MMASSENPKSKTKSHGPTVHAIKRAKYEAKQEHRRQSSAHPPWSSWFIGREDYAARVTVDDVREIRNILGTTSGQNPPALDADDQQILRLRRIAEWIAPFFDLKERPNTRKKDDALFISEGTEAVRMMIQRCDITNGNFPTSNLSVSDTLSPPPVRVFSILAKPATFFDSPTKLIDDLDKRMGGSSISKPSFKIIIADEKALSEIAGFSIHRGAMACAVIPCYNGYAWLTSLLATSGQYRPTRRLLALDAVSNTANMGSIIRTAVAFSIDAIILSDDSCDAWYRQSVRTSMGHVISVPIIRVAEWEKSLSHEADVDDDLKREGLVRCLRWLREKMDVECFAAVVDNDNGNINNGNDGGRGCLPALVSLDSALDCSRRSWCCVLGNEGHGIRDVVVRECDKRLKIDMASGVDSFSLPIAAGILMYGLSRASMPREVNSQNTGATG